MEVGDGTPPTATGYKCTIDTAATTYTVGETTDTTPPTVTVKANTTVKVTVTNKANCTKDLPPPPATTTLTVTKVWAYVGTPAGYPTLGASNAGALNVTVGGTGTGQAWGATKADLKVGDRAAVSEGPGPTSRPTRATPARSRAHPSTPSTVAASPRRRRHSLSTQRQHGHGPQHGDLCGRHHRGRDRGHRHPADDDSDSTDDEQVVAGSEDELAATGANTGPRVWGSC